MPTHDENAKNQRNAQPQKNPREDQGGKYQQGSDRAKEDGRKGGKAS